MNRLIKSQRVRLEAAPGLHPSHSHTGDESCHPSARLIPVDAQSALVEVTCACGETMTLELQLGGDRPSSTAPPAAQPATSSRPSDATPSKAR